MRDPVCDKLRISARMIQDTLISVCPDLSYRNAQYQKVAVDQITQLVEAYETRIQELLGPQELPPIETKTGGGYSN